MSRSLYPLVIGLLFFFVLLGKPGLGAEAIELHDGRTFEGKVIGESDTVLILRTLDGTEVIKKGSIVRRTTVEDTGTRHRSTGGKTSGDGNTRAKNTDPRRTRQNTKLERMSNPGVHDPQVDALLGKPPYQEEDLPHGLRAILGRLQDDRALDVLMTIYFEASDNHMLRLRVLYKLDDCPKAARLPLAYETIAQDKDAYNRGMALKHLCALAAGSPVDRPIRQKADLLIRRALRSKEPWDLRFGGYAAAALWRDEAIAPLLQLARRGVESESAYRAIASVNSEKSLKTLQDAYRTKPLARADIKYALNKQMGKKTAAAFFKQVVASDARKGFFWKLRLPVDFQMVDTPLQEAFKILGKHVHVKFIIDPSVPDPHQPVNLLTSNQSLRECIYYLCFTSGLDYRVERNTVRILKGKVKPLRSSKPPSPRLRVKVTVEYVDTPVAEALRFLRSLAGVGVILSPDALKRARGETVTLHAKDRPLLSLLKTLAKKIGARIVVRGNTVEFH